eukprot:3399261-Pyramimonas_sp.AAC.1
MEVSEPPSRWIVPDRSQCAVTSKSLGPLATGSGASESYGTYAQDASQAALIEKEYNILSLDEALANQEAVEQAMLGELERWRGLE